MAGHNRSTRRAVAAGLAFALALPSTVLAQAPEAEAPAEAKVRPSRRAVGLSQGGAVGIGRLVDASPGDSRMLRLGVRGGFFQAGNFPVSGATNRNLQGELSAGYTFRLPELSGFDPFVEVFGAYRNSSNSNAAANPGLVQAQGDLLLGAKGSVDLFGTTVGADLRFDLRNGIGSDVLSLGGSTFQFRLLGARTIPAKVPVDLMVNLGMALGRSGDALDPRMTPTLLYGTGFSAYHRMLFGVGARVDLEWFSPFVTLDLDQPLGIGADALQAGDTSSFGAAGKRLGLGGRVPLGAGVLDVVAELGTGRGVAGFARTAPYMLFAGYSIALDGGTLGRAVRPVEPVTGQIAGRVLDLATGEPVGGALIALAGEGPPPVASAVDGRFTTLALPPGEVTLRIERDGFEPTTVSARVKAGKTADAEVRLAALPPPPPPPEPEPVVVHAEPEPVGFLAGKVEVNGVISAIVRAVGPRTIETPLAEDGRFSLKVPPGDYTVSVIPEKHVARVARASVGNQEAAVVVLRTVALPEERLLRREDRLLVSESPVELIDEADAPVKAEPALLLEIADLLAREPQWKLRVGVHADPRLGEEDDRQAWTDDRARVLQQALVEAGVASDRLEVVGYGLTRPLFPAESRERSRNRRVEFELVPSGVSPMPAEMPLPPATEPTELLPPVEEAFPVGELPPPDFDELPLDFALPE